VKIFQNKTLEKLSINKSAKNYNKTQ